MTDQETSVSRRSFLKSSALAAGGLMLSVTWLSAFKRGDKTSDPAKKWIEVNGDNYTGTIRLSDIPAASITL